MKKCVQCGERFDSSAWLCPSCGFSPMSLMTSLASPFFQGSDGFDPNAFDRLAQLEHASFWFRSRSRIILWALERYFPHIQRLLEIGCGTGFVLEEFREALPRLSLAGAELHLEGLHHAAQRVPGVELFQFDARNIPFDSEFDVVGAFDARRVNKGGRGRTRGDACGSQAGGRNRAHCAATSVAME